MDCGELAGGVTVGVDGGALSGRLCRVLNTRRMSAASLAVIVLRGFGMLGAGVGGIRDWESVLISMITVEGVLFDPFIRLSIL